MDRKPRKQEVPKSTPSDQRNQANVEEAADEEESFLTKSGEKIGALPGGVGYY